MPNPLTRFVHFISIDSRNRKGVVFRGKHLIMKYSKKIDVDFITASKTIILQLKTCNYAFEPNKLFYIAR